MGIKLIFSYLLDRLSEASTWATIVGLVSAQLHLNLNADTNNWLVQLGLMLAAGAGIFIKEGSSNVTK